MTELKRQSGQLDLNIEDDIGLNFTATYKIDGAAQDVTNFAATFTIRNRNGQEGTALLTLTENDNVAVGTVDGVFTITISEAQAIFGNKGMTYDFVITPQGGVPIRLLRGNITSWAGVK